MGKTDPVLLTRSSTEISVLNSLRSLPSLLLHSRPQSAVTSSVTALRSLCSAQARPDTPSLERWLALAELEAKLDADTQSLEREVDAHERKRSALESSNGTRLPPAEACELGPKLQCLQEVLGVNRFRAYCCDLFVLVRNLRLRLELYGIRMLDFERHLCRERAVSVEKLLWLLNDAEPEEATEPIEHEDYALLFQHCSEPANSEAQVVTEELMALLRSLPLERATLVRYAFEQIADGRRGEGYRPPPDHTRIHHFHAAIKLQRSYCSPEETEAAEAWLEVIGSKAVTLQDFLQFHVTVSDANVSEDAEFVRFVQRMWGFDPLAGRDADRGEAIQQILENYTARCNLLELMARKQELLVKIPAATARIRSTTAQLEAELQHLRALQAPIGISRWLKGDERMNSKLSSNLVLLRELTLSGQVLTSIPSFVASLKELQVLDLRDNRLTSISSALGAMKSLRALNLSDNLLRDASFTGSNDVWSQLEVLTELRLSGNKLTSLPSSLVAIPNLTTLDLSSCSLRWLRGEVVKHWKGRARLVTLDLHGNSLTNLPEEIHVLFGTLRRLYLHQNHLSSLPASVAELIRLEELSLSQNQLTGDCMNSYPLPEGHVAISLAQNQLKTLPRLVVVQVEGKGPSKTLNSSVTSVDIRGNRLRTAVDWSPLVLVNCQSLHLQDNSLRELPEGFFTALPALRVCELQNNQLRVLPVGIVDCTQLQALYVNHNRLQFLPKELPQLPFLEVLNAAENELTEIPLEWHEFETQNDGGRALRSLILRRNPLRNKILLSIVDGGTDVTKFTTDESACEGIVKKLLDGLREASVIVRDRNPTRKAWIDSDEDEESDIKKIKWRGVAKDVNVYLEQRLRAMQRPGVASLTVDVTSFERLIRTLPLTCSKRELAHLVRRFETEVQASEGRFKRQIDGFAFLQAVEQFGRWRSISIPSKRPMSANVKPTTDSAGPIIQYLVVLHRRSLLEEEERAPSPPKPRLKIKLRVKHKEPRKGAKRDPNTKRKPPVVTPTPIQFIKPIKTQADVVAYRQRQRIQVLEQQLVDQKLLLLSHRKPSSAKSKESNGSAVLAPTDLEALSDGENNERRRINISVKCLAPETQQKAPARLDFRLEPDASVLSLKQQIEARTGIPVDQQILVAHSVGSGLPAIRLRNTSVLREYSELVGASRWSLTLLVGQSLQLFSGDSAT